MPKITWLHAAQSKTPQAKPPDYTLELFRRYQKALSISNAALAPLVHCKNAQAVKDKKTQGTARWNKETLLRWSAALQVPPDEFFEALRLDQQAADRRADRHLSK